MSATRRLTLAAGGLLGLAGAVTAAAWVEARAFVLRRVTVPVLPFGSPQIRVLHLSDIHMRPGQQLKQAWLRELVSL